MLKRNKSVFLHKGKRKEGKKGKKSRSRTVFSVFMILFLTLMSLVLFTIFWVKQTWAELSLEEIVYQLTAPLEGTGGGLIGDFILNAVVPTCILLVLGLCLLWLFRNIGKKAFLITSGVITVSSIVTLVVCVTYFWFDIGCDDYFFGSGEDFIAEKYVDPSTVNITFPEQKRNLIYIFLESMEDTYSDEENGGFFQNENLIPELTALAEENEDFSGSDTKLNGGISLPGTTWTVGAMFAQTSGLPLKISIDGNAMSSEDSFFPGITTLGDILQSEGYNNVVMFGSDAAFGGRDKYFSTHGDYSILDYNYAIDAGLIPSDYKVWWGYEDEKLFSFAENELTNLASQGTPFNFTLLTVDTHFEDGYVCDLCTDEFGDNQYANVIACSSRQVAAFVQWIQQQDFYENTTIVISGDHPTMDADFLSDFDDDYFYDRTVYTAYINADATVANPDARRTYSTFDDFPTTLAALGATIDGDRLGLGTNLFSGTQTLTESYGIDAEAADLFGKSAFMEKLSGISAEDSNENALTAEAAFDAKMNSDGDVVISVSDIVNNGSLLRFSYVTITNTTDEDEEPLTTTFELVSDEEGSFTKTISSAELKEFSDNVTIQGYLRDTSGNNYYIGSIDLKRE